MSASKRCGDRASRRRVALRTAAFVVLLGAAGCRAARTNDPLAQLTPDALAQAVAPSNYRNWIPAQAVLPTAERRGDQLTIRNVRNCLYLSDEDYVVRHEDRTYDLAALESVDFIVVPFRDAPSLAHTMLSFGFRGQGHLALSVEARYEEGEKYSPLSGFARQYELIYVVADERDVIGLRSDHRGDRVFLYPTRAAPEQGRRLLLDVMARVNKLAAEPEFYDTLTNNCTTNLVAHVNRVAPGRVPLDVGVLLPGYSDQLAWQLGLLQPSASFADARRKADVTKLARRYAGDPEFSERIRRR